MMNASFRRGLSRLALGFTLLAAACSDNQPSNPKPPDGPGVLDKFQPEGCKFATAPRPEYKEYTLGSPTVGAAPDIRRVRLGLGGNVDVGSAGQADPATTAGFGWQTELDTLASEVQWGTTPDPASWPAENRKSGVTWLSPASVINPQGDDRMHEAYVCGLSPATTYYYRVGGGPAGQEVWSDVYSFTTISTNSDNEILLSVAGDSRGQSNQAWRLIQRRAMKAGATAQLFSGDMIDLALDQGEWHEWLDLAWKDVDGSLLTLGQLLTLSTHGNHENHTLHFYSSVVLPHDVTAYPKYGELFFSVDIGPAHIIVLDDFWITSPTGDPEYLPALQDWLERDLKVANVNRASVPWIIAMHHHGEFSSSSHGTDLDVLRGRQFFVPIWDKYHVDLLVLGHDHNYERSKPLTGPLSGATLDPVVHDKPSQGTVYMICAGAGADPYGNGMSAFTDISRNYQAQGSLGFYTFLKINKTAINIETHELRADETDPVIDFYAIKK